MSNSVIASHTNAGMLRTEALAAVPRDAPRDALHPRLRAQLNALDGVVDPAGMLSALLPRISQIYQQLDDEQRGALQTMQSLAQQSRYQAMVTQAPEAVLVLDPLKGVCTDANEQALRSLGIRRSELADFDVSGLLELANAEGVPDDTRVDLDATALAAGLDEPNIFEWACSDARGVPLLLEVRLAPLPGAEGLLRAAFNAASARRRDQLLAAGDRELFRCIAADAPLQGLLDSIIALVESVCGDVVACISLMGADGGRVTAVRGAQLPESLRRMELNGAIDTRNGTGIAAMFFGRQVLATDIATDPHWTEWRELATIEGLMSACAVPIKAASGVVEGAITVYSRPRGIPAHRDIEVYLHAARLAAIVIEHVRAAEATRALLSDTTRTAALPPFPGSSDGVDSARAQVTLHSISDAVVTADQNGCIDYLNPVAAQLTGWNVLEARGMSVDAVLNLRDEMTRAEFPHPLLRALREGVVVGVSEQCMMIDRSGGELAVQYSAAPIRDAAGLTVGAVVVFRDVTREHHLKRALSYQAKHDALTGLINRREFDARLAAALDSARAGDGQHALLYIDLDQFKIVNDTCGHAAGDRLLRDVTAILQQQVRSADSIARLGGDEFGIIAQHCTVEQALRLAEGIRQVVQNYRFMWEQREFRIGASIGVVGINRESEAATSLLSAADIACYAAKDAGRNRVHVYDNGDASDRQRDMFWVSRVTRAVEEGRLELYQQPILATGEGAQRMQFHELLVRMRGEGDALVLPGEFVPAAERYNVITAIDRWVVRRAADLIIARATHGLPPTLLIAVNISSASICERNFLEFVLGLTENPVVGRSLCFELAESAVVNNMTQTAEFMSTLKARGCRFTLDNFGSGPASLQCLRTLPVDFLKIDGDCTAGIVDDPVDRSIVEALLKIAHAQRIATIAERVESAPVWGQLVKLGVDYVQGFQIARPQPLATLTELALRE
jgi:diguanylate cyclase (GGDEF)-like protein/PAS domain S-box-containing protein